MTNEYKGHKIETELVNDPNKLTICYTGSIYTEAGQLELIIGPYSSRSAAVRGAKDIIDKGKLFK